MTAGKNKKLTNYQRIYEYRFQGIDQNKRFRVWQEIAAYIYKKMGAPEKVLDPAAGRCEFVNAISAGEIWAIDKEESVLEYKRQKIHALVENIFSARLPQNYFQGVFVSNFLEHLESGEAVSKFLRKMRTSLASGGKIAILGPNFKYCQSDYFDCCDHKLPLTHITVKEWLYSEGYTICDCYARFLPFSFRGRLPPSPRMTCYYLWFPLLWKIFGKQYLIIAEKTNLSQV